MEVNGQVAAVQARVAVLEDESLMRETLVLLLEGAGFQVVGQYSDPATFLARLPVDQPAVAILDVADVPGGGPQDGGVSFIRDTHRRYPDVQLLVFSGCTDPEIVERCYREGAAGYLNKHSARREAVLRAVEAVAQGERIFPVHLVESPFRPAAREPEPPALQAVSAREREVLTYVAAGADNLKIATILQISERTVKAHVSSLYRKLGSENRTQLALAALQLGVRPSTDV